jgi:hypothetical protein
MFLGRVENENVSPESRHWPAHRRNAALLITLVERDTIASKAEQREPHSAPDEQPATGCLRVSMSGVETLSANWYNAA